MLIPAILMLVTPHLAAVPSVAGEPARPPKYAPNHPPGSPSDSANRSESTPRLKHPASSVSPATLPLAFEPNRGQFPAGVEFAARAPGFSLALKRKRAVLVLGRPGAGENEPRRAAIYFVGSSHSKPEGEDLETGVSNYLLGNDPSRWRTGVPRFGRVRYRDLYPGIDLKFYGNGRQLEYDFVIAPEANPSAIVLRFSGVSRLETTSAGDLLIDAGGARIAQRAPRAYQMIGGVRRSVAAFYQVEERSKLVQISVASYDRAKPLIIDPVLEYGTFFGGSNTDGVNSLAVDSAGNAYITGQTISASLTGLEPGSLQPARKGGWDAFVAKINAAGTAIVYSTFLGGSLDDIGASIAVDSSGNAYLCGITSSTDFPITSGAYQSVPGGGPEDAFITAINAFGTGLLFRSEERRVGKEC